jgi:hypothetical protein
VKTTRPGIFGGGRATWGSARVVRRVCIGAAALAVLVLARQMTGVDAGTLVVPGVDGVVLPSLEINRPIHLAWVGYEVRGGPVELSDSTPRLQWAGC